MGAMRGESSHLTPQVSTASLLLVAVHQLVGWGLCRSTWAAKRYVKVLGVGPYTGRLNRGAC